jgi:signal transduction histidine kinase
VHVRIELLENRLELTIKDNGRGLRTAEHGRKGEGIVNMRNRVSELGGMLAIDPQPEGGITIRICVPMPIDSTEPTNH